MSKHYVPPTPAEVRALLSALGLTGAGAADLMGLSDARQVRKYTGGTAPRSMSFGALYALLHRAGGLTVKPATWRTEAAALLREKETGVRLL